MNKIKKASDFTIRFWKRKYSKSVIDRIIPKKHGSIALVSLSKNIYHNLALENYLAENVDLKNRNILLMWISEPCIVFGRHQNPWVECNVKEALSRDVKVVRRYSGGGCVYHDHGNLNISFITDRQRYDRKYNLTIIKNSMEKLNFNNISFEITSRHDIFVKNHLNLTESFKISGSAARLASKFSYHHCTLLFDANLDNMKLLRSNLNDLIVTKATPSIRSKCINLKNFLFEQSFDISHLITKLSEEFWRFNSVNWSSDFLYQYVNPEEDEIIKTTNKYSQELSSWDFAFGSTPKFDLLVNLENNRKIIFSIVNGHINNYLLEEISDENFIQGLNILLNTKFKRESIIEKFKTHNLINFHSQFIQLFEFFNKNI